MDVFNDSKMILGKNKKQCSVTKLGQQKLAYCEFVSD